MTDTAASLALICAPVIILLAIAAIAAAFN
jgi:hypothetical protein